MAAAVKSALSRKAIAFRPCTRFAVSAITVILLSRGKTDFFAAEETYFDWLWAGVQVRRVEAFRSICNPAFCKASVCGAHA